MLSVVPTPIGNLGDISSRAIKTLEDASLIYCEDTRISKKLFHLLEISTEHKTFISLHSHNENHLLKSLDPISIATQNVVYISDAGMPGVSDPGQALINFCHQYQIEVDVLPGANAVLTAFVASGFVTTKFLFFGFLPHKGKERENALQEALYSGYTTILYEAPHRIDVLIKRLAEVAPDRIVFLAKELTKKHQTFYKDSVQNLANQLNTINTKGEWVVVIEAGEQRQQSSLSVDDILALKLAPKQSAKLLSKLTGQPVKEWYNKLLSHD